MGNCLLSCKVGRLESKAHNAYIRGDYKLALELCFEVLDIKEQATTPTEGESSSSLDVAGIYHNIGMILEKQGEDLDGAIQNYEIALKIRERHKSRDEIQSHKALAAILEKKGHPIKAKKHRQKAIEIDKERPIEPLVVSEL